MCEPMAIGLGVQGFATLLKAQSQLSQGEAAKARSGLSAGSALRAAADAISRGEAKDLQVAMHGSAIVADQRTAIAATGADVNIGGAQAVQSGTMAVSEVDRATVRRNAALEAFGLRSKAQTFYQEGEDASVAAKNAALGTFLGGIGGAIGSGGKFLADVKSGTDEAPADTSYGGGPWADEAD